jgi:hypothetical protein
MLFAVSNLLHESVVVTTRDVTSFAIFIFNQTENHLADICNFSFDFNDKIMDVAVSEVSEDASKFVAVIATKFFFHVVSGNTKGSILFQKNIQHHNKNPHNIHSMYIPLNKQVVCFCDNTIFLFNPFEESISVTQTALKIDATKHYFPLQQDQFTTQEVLVSLNNGPNIFILEKSKLSSYNLFICFTQATYMVFVFQGLLSDCHALKCCEVTEGGDVLVWWDADISSSAVSITRISIFNTDDAVLLATGQEVRVYTLDGLLGLISLGSALGLQDSGDVITAVQGVHAPSDPAVMRHPPFIDHMDFLVATFHNDGLFLCSVALPSDDTAPGDPIALTNVTSRRLHLSYDSFAFFCLSFPTQIVADDTNVFDSRHHSFIPYFDSISILQLDCNLAIDTVDNTTAEGHLLVKNSAFGMQMVRVSLSPFGKFMKYVFAICGYAMLCYALLGDLN